MKNLILGIATAALIASGAPAFAYGAFGNGTPDQRENRSELLIIKLKERGVDAVRVEEWGQYLRAYVRSPDGGTHMEFFDPRTLTPANL